MLDIKAVIFVKNESESNSVQKALFESGFHWFSPHRIQLAQNTKSNFLGVESNMRITHCNDFQWIVEAIKDRGIVALNGVDVIKNPSIVPGAIIEDLIEIDGKKYSKSTIKEALREYAKGNKQQKS